MITLTVVVIVGLAICYAALHSIEHNLRECLLELKRIASTGDDTNSSTQQISTTLESIQEHFEKRFPTFEEPDERYPHI